MLLFLSDNMIEGIPVEKVYIPTFEKEGIGEPREESLWDIIPPLFGKARTIYFAICQGDEEELNEAVADYLCRKEAFFEGEQGKIEKLMRWKDSRIWKIVQSISPSTEKTVFDSSENKNQYEKTHVFLSPQYTALKRIKHGDKVSVLGPQGYVSDLNAHVDSRLSWFELRLFNEYTPIISEKGTHSSFIDTIYVKKK